MKCKNYEKFMASNPFGNDNTVLIFKDEKVKVSKSILCIHTDYFYDLFFKNITQNEFEITAFNVAAFHCLYEAINKGESYKLTGENVLKLLDIRQVVDLEDLDPMIENWIRTDESKQYLMKILKHACMFRLESLIKLCQDKMSDNYKN
uniref:BTB domain-containing protein n=1 Tax=Rhabditophanes sp. KR3021 TaxID=114890 RepID=A0AC35TQU3_9BILA